MDLRKLAFLRAVANLKSFTLAAEQMHVSPPALTKGIKSLELELQTRLIERQRGGAVLTYAGQKVLLRAEKMLDEAEAIRRDVHAFREKQQPIIRIGCGPLVNHFVLGKVMVMLDREHPDIGLSVTTGRREDLDLSLEYGDIDILISELNHRVRKTIFTVEALPGEHLVWACSDTHPLSARGQLRFQDILEYSVAAPIDLIHDIESLRGQFGLDVMNRFSGKNKIRTDHFGTLISMVNEASLLATFPESLARDLARRHNIRLLDVVDWKVRSHPCVVTHGNRALSPAIRSVIDSLREVSASLVPGVRVGKN